MEDEDECTILRENDFQFEIERKLVKPFIPFPTWLKSGSKVKSFYNVISLDSFILENG